MNTQDQSVNKPGAVWGVTNFIDGADEGISIIELFATKDLATAFRNEYDIHRPGQYGVTKFKVWDEPMIVRK